MPEDLAAPAPAVPGKDERDGTGESGIVTARSVTSVGGLRERRSAAIYFITHPDGQGWNKTFATAAALGFNGVLLASPFATSSDPSLPRSGRLPSDYGRFDGSFGGGDALVALRQVADAARAAGLDLLLDLDIAAIAAHAPLAAAHPDWFAHSTAGARFHFVSEDDAAVAWWDDRLAQWQAAGVNGFRLKPDTEVPAFVFRRLITDAKSRDTEAIFIADTTGLPDHAIAALTGAGFSCATSSSYRWDFRSDWLDREAMVLAPLAPVLARASCGRDAPAPYRRRALSFAAFFAAGWIMDAGLEAGLEDHVTVLNGIRASSPTLRSAPAARLVSSAGAGIAILARREMVLALNPSDTAAAMLDAAAILPGLGATSLVSLDGAEEITPAAILSMEPAGAEFYTIAAARPVFEPYQPPLNTAAARIGIEAITPQVDQGQYPVRRLMGELVSVEADIIADGHDKLAGEIAFRALDETRWRTAPLTLIVNDRWRASFPLERLGRHVFTVTAWKDAYATWVDEVVKKHAAGVPIGLELREGINHVAEAAAAGLNGTGPKLNALLDWLRTADEPTTRIALVSAEVVGLMHQADLRKFATTSHEVIVDAERKAAAFAGWYEIFPRSQAGNGKTHGTFQDVIHQLPRIAGMGFDVLYFPPIHPIGMKFRKGRNNTLTPAPEDPGSPYAIGSADGGHDAIHPELGTLADFHAMRDAAAAHGLELALDFAIQCSMDHPWLTEHPGWFDYRPDGSIKYAENPPKKYQDIVNVDFYAADAVPGLWLALRDIVQFWVDQGVKLFRVDNPHTKPLPFWEWMIGDIRSRHPDTAFLAEAFTKPKLMYRLAKIGFGQSYTYFTWRNEKWELESYLTELSTTAPKDFFRPHFFVNTPDINPVFLQTSGRGGFLIRAALAATLSGLWGVYNGFELCEGRPVPGKEEYIDSEKYELKAWDYDRPGNIIAEITRLNHIRRTNLALHSHLNVEFLPCDSEKVVYFRKFGADGNTLLIAISTDPHNVQPTRIELPLWRFGQPDDGALEAEDLMRDYRFTWHGKWQDVSLNPSELPFCIWRISAPA